MTKTERTSHGWLESALSAANPHETNPGEAQAGDERRLSDSRAQQMAALYEIGLSITAQLDLKPILYSLYEHVQRLLSPDVFYIAIYHEPTHAVDFPLFFDQGAQRSMPPRDVLQTPGVTGAVILKKQTLVIPDTLEIPAKAQFQYIRTGGQPTRTYVGVPMISHNRMIGVISMQKYLPDAYTLEEIRLLETIATQAAIAIDNSQLFENLQKELEQHRQAQAAADRARVAADKALVAADESRLALEKANQQLQAQVQQNEALRLELQEQAIRDPLTGLFNRRYLKETLDREVARARRDGSAIGIIIMDIDEFKIINDSFGHTAGDRYLQAMAGLLKTNIRFGDIVCRYGGEEFVIVMPGASLQIAYERAERLRHFVETLYEPYENERLHATISLGVTAYPVHGTDSDDLLIRADRAMYQAKQEGRNRARAYRSFTKPLSLDY